MYGTLLVGTSLQKVRSMAASARAIGAGRRLQEVREHVGVSQLLLAQLIRVSKGTIQNYESGRVPLHVGRMGQIARALNVEPADLLAQPGAPLPKLRGILQPQKPLAQDFFGLIGSWGFYSRDAHMRTGVQLDAQAKQALGIPADAPGQVPWGKFAAQIHPDDSPEFKTEFERLGKTGLFNLRYRQIGFDGVERVILDCAGYSRDEKRRNVRLQGQ